MFIINAYLRVTSGREQTDISLTQRGLTSSFVLQNDERLMGQRCGSQYVGIICFHKFP